MPVQIVRKKKTKIEMLRGFKVCVVLCVCERECVEYKVLYKMFVYNSCV